jgi:hypothetical protein
MTSPRDPRNSKPRSTAFDNDPFGGIKDEKKDPSPSAREVNLFHSNSDVDSHAGAQHHSIGVKHDQASSGDHVHDGIGSRKLGQGMGLVLTGAKGGNVALANLITMLKQVIDFTDSTTA